MKDKLKELHNQLAEKLLEKVRDEEVTASELNVARQFLRDNDISSEIFLESKKKLSKQLEYASKRGLSVAIICGENEFKDNNFSEKAISQYPPSFDGPKIRSYFLSFVRAFNKSI